MQYKFYYLLSEKHTTHRQEIFIGKKYNNTMKRTILLTSTGGKSVKDTFLRILPKDPKDIHLAHIITASNEQIPHPWRDDDTKALRDMGIQVMEIDVKGKTKNELQELFKDMDVIYVQGGDPYYLLKYAKESGFMEVVKELVNQGMLYVGVSAGSYLAGPTMEQGLWRKPDRDRHGMNIDEPAMGLVPFLTVVHYVDGEKEIMKQGIAKTKYPVRIITDTQGLLVQDDEVTFVGTGEEIRL